MILTAEECLTHLECFDDTDELSSMIDQALESFEDNEGREHPDRYLLKELQVHILGLQDTARELGIHLKKARAKVGNVETSNTIQNRGWVPIASKRSTWDEETEYRYLGGVYKTYDLALESFTEDQGEAPEAVVEVIWYGKP